MDNIIEIKNLSFKYDEDNSDSVLENFSLNIERGSFTCILGHNGSGKSTLAKLFNGLLLPQSGQVVVDGLSTTDEKNAIEIKRRVGLVFQNPDNQIISSVVEEDVAFGPENLGIPPEEIRIRVDNALKTVGMYEFKDSAPHKLSGGQKQRVAIAGILAMSTECIVLDEPTAMLDPKGRKEVMESVLKLNKEQGITIVFITHFMEEAANADRVIVMNDGVIVSDGTPKEVFSDISTIRSVGLDLPQTTELLDIISANGFETEKGIITAEECADEIYQLIKRSKGL